MNKTRAREVEIAKQAGFKIEQRLNSAGRFHLVNPEGKDVDNGGFYSRDLAWQSKAVPRYLSNKTAALELLESTGECITMEWGGKTWQISLAWGETFSSPNFCEAACDAYQNYRLLSGEGESSDVQSS